MPLIFLDNAQLAYGHVPLLDCAAFKLDKGERRNRSLVRSVMAAAIA